MQTLLRTQDEAGRPNPADTLPVIQRRVQARSSMRVLLTAGTVCTNSGN